MHKCATRSHFLAVADIPLFMQYSNNLDSQYCAVWWLDEATYTKINTTHICYSIIQNTADPISGKPVQRKWGCAHLAPVNGFIGASAVNAGAVAATVPGAAPAAAAGPAAAATAAAPAAASPAPAPSPSPAPAPSGNATSSGGGSGGNGGSKNGGGSGGGDSGAGGDGGSDGGGGKPSSAPAAARRRLHAAQSAGAPEATLLVPTAAFGPDGLPQAEAPVSGDSAPGKGIGIGTLDEFTTTSSVYNPQGLEYDAVRALC